MKKLILIITLALLGCSNDNTVPEPQGDTLLGAWRLIEIYASDDGSYHEWNVVPEQFRYTYIFGDKNDVIRDTYECDGVYENTLDYLEMNFDCQNNQYYMKFSDVTFEDNNLILTPDPNCDEGCALKFKRVNVN